MSKLRIADDLTLDLARLVDSRMLIAANSGGGKSWLLRLVAEQACGKAQVVILDPEGEFATLREKFDFLLVGSTGEVPAEPRAAGLLARRIMELQASAVIDLSDLKLADRRRFVRLYLESLMGLPKTLWRPLLVGIDEAHLFCPERSAGEAESTDAVIALMSQGRKRSYAGVLITQRLSKLHKDAEAEANNVFIGRCWQDVDQKRAGALLGMGKDEYTGLRDLAAGEFFGFGPALSANGITRFKAADVVTTHPKPGSRHKLTPPKPSDAVRRLLADLKDLPQQAEAEVKDLAGAQKEIARLKLELAKKPVPVVAAPPVVERVEVPVLTREAIEHLQEVVNDMRTAAGGIVQAVEKAARSLLDRNRVVKSPTVPPPPVKREPRPAAEPTGELDKPRQAILDTVAMLDTRGITPDRESVARWLSIHPNGGRYGSNLAWLRAEGYLEGFYLTGKGREAARPLPTGLDAALAALDDEPKREIVRAVVEQHPLTRDELAAKLGLHPNGGRYGSNLAWLRTMGIITGRGSIAPTPGLFA